MNRRGFLKRLVGIAAAAAVFPVGKIFAGPAELSFKLPVREVVPRGTSIADLRAESRRRLAQWFAQEHDRLMFEALSR